MDAETKKTIIEEYAIAPGDTGSPDVQIALLVGQRRRLLNYVAKQDVEHYRSLIARLGLRR